jgi:hypothetical protein
MTDGSATVSTALEVSDSVLECYYGTNQPRITTLTPRTRVSRAVN